MLAFITGSRQYGIPNRYSDIDLVVPMDKATFEALSEFSDEDPRSGADTEYIGHRSLRFGNVNMICIIEPVAWKVWTRSTRFLMKEKISSGPVTKERAKEVFSYFISLICKACEGKGKSSSGNRCVPCNGDGLKESTL